jgi:hypothetical protein
MKLLTKTLALALLLVSVAVASASPVGAAGRGQSTTTPLAGPWYTPQELKALIAYSNASFAQKKAMLGGSTAPSAATNRGLVLAGPRGAFDWGDAGVGAAGAFGLALLASGITVVSRHNRRNAS